MERNSIPSGADIANSVTNFIAILRGAWIAIQQFSHNDHRFNIERTLRLCIEVEPGNQKTASPEQWIFSNGFRLNRFRWDIANRFDPATPWFKTQLHAIEIVSGIGNV